MLSLRRIISGAMLLVLLLTSGTMASARGEMRDASGAIIICTGHGLVTILVDQNGEPIEAGHICPDCAMTVLVAPEGTSELPSVSIEFTRVDWAYSFEQPLAQNTSVALARGPPLV